MAVEVDRKGVTVRHEAGRYVLVRDGILLVLSRGPQASNPEECTVAVHAPGAWDNAIVKNEDNK